MRKTAALILAMMIILTKGTVSNSEKLDKNELSASSAVVICADNGQVLFEKNAYEKRPMASTTKIMTSLLAVEAADAIFVAKVDFYISVFYRLHIFTTASEAIVPHCQPISCLVVLQ